jgi:hypothetical protein
LEGCRSTIELRPQPGKEFSYSLKIVNAHGAQTEIPQGSVDLGLAAEMPIFLGQQSVWAKPQRSNCPD